MSGSRVNWVFLALVGGFGLVLVMHMLVPPPKAGARRSQSVNRLANVSFTLPITSVPPAITPRQ